MHLEEGCSGKSTVHSIKKLKKKKKLTKSINESIIDLIENSTPKTTKEKIIELENKIQQFRRENKPIADLENKLKRLTVML